MVLRLPRFLRVSLGLALAALVVGLPAAPAAASATAAPVRAVAGSAGAVQVPVLMYHYIRVNPIASDRYGADLSVTPAHFAAQMRLLATHGFHPISLQQLADAFLYGTALPSRPVVLSFDDGYADFYTAAYPILQAWGFRATSFIITGKVGWGGYLTWAQMRQMQASGLIDFESHTVNHVELGLIALSRAQYEMQTSKAVLEAQLGRPIRFLCYPSGSYSYAVEQAAAADGYVAAFTTQPGSWESAGTRFALPRVRIHGSTTLAGFAWLVGTRVRAADYSTATPAPARATSPAPVQAAGRAPAAPTPVPAGGSGMPVRAYAAP